MYSYPISFLCFCCFRNGTRGFTWGLADDRHFDTLFSSGWTREQSPMGGGTVFQYRCGKSKRNKWQPKVDKVYTNTIGISHLTFEWGSSLINYVDSFSDIALSTFFCPVVSFLVIVKQRQVCNGGGEVVSSPLFDIWVLNMWIFYDKE